jgi:hypothetical protein
MQYFWQEVNDPLTGRPAVKVNGQDLLPGFKF